MYTELFEKQAKILNINKVNQTNLFVELIIKDEILEKIDAQKLFMDASEISTNFKFNYSDDKLSIKLMLKDLDKHFIYYLTDLVLKIENK